MPEEEGSKTLRTCRTVGLRDFVPKIHYGNRAELQELFDSTPIKEAREMLLSQLRDPSYEEGVAWFEERIRDFTAINDLSTTFMLLRALSYVSTSYRSRAFACIMDVFEGILDKRPAVDNTSKELIVIFCGHIKQNPESYDSRARECVRRVLNIGSHLSASEEQLRNIKRLLLIISMVRDIELLSEVRKLVIPLTDSEHGSNGLDYYFGYLSVCEEEIEVDAYARQCVAILEKEEVQRA